MGSLWVLWFPPTIQMHAVIRVRLTGASKLAADECECEWLSVSKCYPCHRVVSPPSYGSWDWFVLPSLILIKKIKIIRRGWIVCYFYGLKKL